MATREQLIEDFADHKYATGEKFARLINSMKLVQEPVESPAESGTSNSFIDSISQGADGKITATKKSVVLNYARIQDKPTINGVTLMGDKTPAQLGLATANQVEVVSNKVDKLPSGYYYGKFNSVEDLPEATEKGYAYVASSDPTVFYTYLVSGAGAEWVDSGNKMVNTVDLTTPKTAETELSKEEKYYASANVSDRPADVVIETGVVRSLGYRVLSPNLSFAEQVTVANTIYEIKDSFDLSDGSVTIPANCTLKFNGGKLKNGTIVGDYTSVEWYANNPIFDITITISGVWKINFITPEWFGAKGDGVNDDTLVLRKCVYTATLINCCIHLRKGASYVLSGELNSFNGSVYDIKGLTIEGFCDKSRWGNSPMLEGFKLVGNNFSLFQTANLNIVSIKNVGIFTSSGNNTTNGLSAFDDCTLQRCTINECTINGLEIFLKDTSLQSCTSISNNRINCFNFTKKQNKTTIQLVDSVISKNYISGVSYDNVNYDNVCFSFDVYNGSNITDNFIDYFRVIYDPGESNYASGNISSSNNQYQVFLYFYNNIDNITYRTLALSSIGDSFNWNDPSKLGYLNNYTKNTYKGLDDNDYNVPPYIGIIGEHSRISFVNAILENNLKTDSILFLDNLPNDRKSYFRFKTSRNKESSNTALVSRKEGYSETDNKPYILNNICITEWLDLDSLFIETVDSLPTIKYRSASPSGNYSKYVIGEKVYFNNTLFVLSYKKRGNVGLFGWSPLIYLPDDSQPIEYGRSGSTKINVKSTITIVEKGQTSNDFTGTFDVDGTILNKPIVFFNQSSSGNSNYIEFKSSSCPITYKGAPLKLYGQQIAIIVFRSNTKAFCIYASGYAENGTSTQRPNISAIGFNYFDTTLGKPIYWNGSAWVDANGDYIVDNSGTLQNRLALTSPVKGQQFKLTGGANDVYLIYGDYGWLKATDGTPWFDDSGTLNAMYDKYNYTLLTEQPDDWQTAYNTYYKIVNNVYTLLTTLETWTADTYYKKDVNVYKGIQVKLTDTDTELLNKVVKWNSTKYINIVDNVALKAGTPIVTFTTENNTTTATITSTSSGKIYYTKDGSTPTSSSTEYSSAITLTDGDQVKAICIRDHMDNSAPGFVPVSVPVITFSSAGILTITCDTADAKIYYTTDGSTPTTSSTEYDSSASVTIAKNVTVKALAVLIGRVNSDVASKKRS